MKAKAQVQEVIQGLISKQDTPLSTSERERLLREVLHEVFGLGPLEPLLQDATINDILVNTYRKVYVERAGVLEKTSVSFKDDAHLSHIIDKIVSQVGRRVDESSPMCDARLADGSRVNVIIPPLAVDGPILSIRRFGKIPIGSEQLLANRTVTAPIFDAIKAAVRAKLNIIISGGTGAGMKMSDLMQMRDERVYQRRANAIVTTSRISARTPTASRSTLISASVPPSQCWKEKGGCTAARTGYERSAYAAGQDNRRRGAWRRSSRPLLQAMNTAGP